jgi:hypothetical protein
VHKDMLYQGYSVGMESGEHFRDPLKHTTPLTLLDKGINIGPDFSNSIVGGPFQHPLL